MVTHGVIAMKRIAKKLQGNSMWLIDVIGCDSEDAEEIEFWISQQQRADNTWRFNTTTTEKRR